MFNFLLGMGAGAVVTAVVLSLFDREDGATVVLRHGMQLHARLIRAWAQRRATVRELERQLALRRRDKAKLAKYRKALHSYRGRARMRRAAQEGQDYPYMLSAERRLARSLGGSLSSNASTGNSASIS